MACRNLNITLDDYKPFVDLFVTQNGYSVQFKCNEKISFCFLLMTENHYLVLSHPIHTDIHFNDTKLMPCSRSIFLMHRIPNLCYYTTKHSNYVRTFLCRLSRIEISNEVRHRNQHFF